ncbi:MAG: Hsp20/alpha crystallin family protein [Promethearchaeota archaeon]
MNENRVKEQDIEPEEEAEIEKEALEIKKKQEEIANIRSEASHFKIKSAESLEIKEDEPFYRSPLVNIIESEDLYYFIVELPGLDKKHVEISLQGGILELRGEKAIKDKEKKDEKKEKDKKDKKDEKKEKDKKREKYEEVKGNYIRREIRTDNFFRSFLINEEDINAEEIDASFKNGVLRLIIPKKTAKISDKRVIEIK